MIITFAILSVGTALGLFFCLPILIFAAPAVLLFTYLGEASQGYAFPPIAISVLINETTLQFGYLLGATLRCWALAKRIQDH